MGRDAQTLSTKNYARNSAPLVPSRKNVAPAPGEQLGGRPRVGGRRRQRGVCAARLSSVSAEHFRGNEPEPRAGPPRRERGHHRAFVSGSPFRSWGLLPLSLQTKQPPLTERLQEPRASDQALQA